MKYRKSDSGSTRLVSFRIDEDTLKELKGFNINLNAQVNHYLHNLLIHLYLYEGTGSIFVYTK